MHYEYSTILLKKLPVMLYYYKHHLRQIIMRVPATRRNNGGHAENNFGNMPTDITRTQRLTVTGRVE